jgi:hypothetical protein
MTELLLRSDVRGDRLEVGDEVPERTRREPLAGAGLSYRSRRKHIVAIKLPMINKDKYTHFVRARQ